MTNDVRNTSGTAYGTRSDDGSDERQPEWDGRSSPPTSEPKTGHETLENRPRLDAQSNGRNAEQRRSQPRQDQRERVPNSTLARVSLSSEVHTSPFVREGVEAHDAEGRPR